MELQFYGANCLKISTKSTAIVVDDNLAAMGKKVSIKPRDVSIYTASAPKQQSAELGFVVSMPGEYEISNTSIVGVAARAHMAESSTDHSATIYKIVSDDIRLCVVGHVYPELSEDQLETIGIIDILVIPVGGNGFTLDPVGAAKLIRKIEPKVVIPTHFDSKALSYEVPQRSLEDAMKELGLESRPLVDKLKLKSSDFAESASAVYIQPLAEL